MSSDEYSEEELNFEEIYKQFYQKFSKHVDIFFLSAGEAEYTKSSDDQQSGITKEEILKIFNDESQSPENSVNSCILNGKKFIYTKSIDIGGDNEAKHFVLIEKGGGQIGKEKVILCYTVLRDLLIGCVSTDGERFKMIIREFDEIITNY